MRTQLSKFALAAAFGLALAFTFSCSNGDDPDEFSGSSSSKLGKISSSSVKSSSSIASSSSEQCKELWVDNGELVYRCPSSSSNGDVSSSGSYPVSSPGGGGSSSSVAGAVSSSSIKSSSSNIPPSSSSIATKPSSSSGSGFSAEGTFVDKRDNTTYKWVTIGTQTWMAQNLNYEVPGSKCYSNDEANCATYGRLYNWATAMDGSHGSAALPSEVQGICPDGWHLPSDPEWTILINYAGQAATQLKANSTLWKTNKGTDYYGFSALPGGYVIGNSFYYVNSEGHWWTTSQYTGSEALRIEISGGVSVSRNQRSKDYFYSVRCVKDGYIAPSIPSHANGGTFVDSRDGKTYKTIKIGTQTWMAENLNYATTGSKCYTINEANCNTYGRMYDWETVMQGSTTSDAIPSGVQGVCPDGWHLPSYGEWDTLISSTSGATAGTQLKANSVLWTNNTGTDYYGFSALPGGYSFSGSDDAFSEVGYYGYWWTASHGVSIYYTTYYINGNNASVSSSSKDKSYSLSVRCVKD